MIELVDTHNHLYLPEFENDRQEMVSAAIAAGVKKMYLPNVDMETLPQMMEVVKTYPGTCFPMLGLHPTSVKENFEEVLEEMNTWLEKEKFVAIGETGIDLYWDKTFFKQQVKSLKIQINWALDNDLPLVIHSRNSTSEITDLLEEYRGSGLKGVMHCFPGDVSQAEWFADFGFLLGIGGVVTFKNSQMAKVVEALGAEHLILETDAPYLAPVPYRGKRNQPSYIPVIAEKVAELKNLPVEEIAKITTQNAFRLFKTTD
jgi:TatD DNase family protein